jgi:hypothetical protein
MKFYFLVIACLVFAIPGAFAQPAPVQKAASTHEACSKTVGAARAKELVAQCLNVSPATRPPCNAANACELIVAEIERGCGFLKGDPTAPAYCKQKITAARPTPTNAGGAGQR